MPRYAILAVEGQHDQAFVVKLLRRMGLNLYDGVAATLDRFWRPFVPTYPTKEGKLYARMDMPSIVFNHDIEVAVYCAEGSNLHSTFPATFVATPRFKTEVAAFGIIADSDDAAPAKVASDYADVFRQHFPNIPSAPGAVDTSAIRTGIFVLPDNANQGSLESLLLECADVVYPDLKAKARAYLDGIDRTLLNAGDLKDIRKPFGENKAWAGCVSTVLKPGKTIQTSIQDNRWIEPRTQALPSVQRLADFLKELLNIP